MGAELSIIAGGCATQLRNLTWEERGDPQVATAGLPRPILITKPSVRALVRYVGPAARDQQAAAAGCPKPSSTWPSGRVGAAWCRGQR